MHSATSSVLAMAVAATMMMCDGGPASAPDAGPEPATCAADSECRLVSSTCCGTCDQPRRDQVTAVHTSQTEAHRESVCGTSGPAVCDACLPSLEGWEAFCNAAERCDVRARSDGGA